MDDLVERLRRERCITTHGENQENNAERSAAADEIVRLRAALDELGKCFECRRGDHSEHEKDGCCNYLEFACDCKEPKSLGARATYR